MTTDVAILILPGLREHVPEHWQTLLAARLARVFTVPPLEQDKLSCAARVDALECALRAIAGPVIVVAHSAGVMMLAHWAQKHRNPAIKGALLATPADVETPFPAGYPGTDTLREHGWLPIPRQSLPFPTLLAASENDPLCTFARAHALADDWGSELVNLGTVGHLNPAAGYGEWPQALELIGRLDRRAGGAFPPDNARASAGAIRRP